MTSRNDGPSGHVPLKSITGEGLLRAVEAEAEALRIIHVRIQKQLQNLETEEKLLQHMVNRTRGQRTEQELQDFDQQYAQEQIQRQQQAQQPRQQQQQPPSQQQPQQSQQAQQQQQSQPGTASVQQGQQQEGSQLQQLMMEHPLLGQHRQHVGGFRRGSSTAGAPQAPAPAPQPQSQPVQGPPGEQWQHAQQQEQQQPQPQPQSQPVQEQPGQQQQQQQEQQALLGGRDVHGQQPHQSSSTPVATPQQ